MTYYMSPLQKDGPSSASSSPSSASHSSLQVSPTLMWLSMHFAPTTAPNPASSSADAAPTANDGNSASTSTADPAASNELHAFLDSQKPNTAHSIAQLVAHLCDKLGLEGGKTDYRRIQAIRLFYVVLENMLSNESNRMEVLHYQRQTALQQQQQQAALAAGLPPPEPKPMQPFIPNYDNYLFKRQFHASTLALCFEIILFAHGDTARLFPHTSDIFDLSALDIWRNIEMVVRALPSVITTTCGAQGSVNPPPTVLKKYLDKIKQECLCWKIWEKSSPLVQEVQRVAKEKEKAANGNGSSHNQEKKNGEDTASTNRTSEEKTDIAAPALSSATSSPSRPSFSFSSSSSTSSSSSSGNSASIGGITSREYDSFSRQFFRLAADHLHDLCSNDHLDIHPGYYLDACWELFLEIMLNHTYLMFERHLDTILLCIIYNIVVKIAAPLPNANTTMNNSHLAPHPIVTPPAIDFKQVTHVYSVLYKSDYNRVVREISSWCGLNPWTTSSSRASAPSPTSAASPTATTAVSSDTAAVPSTSTKPVSPTATGTTKLNIIFFYNSCFIHAIKFFSVNVIKPKLLAAIAADNAQKAAAHAHAQHAAGPVRHAYDAANGVRNQRYHPYSRTTNIQPQQQQQQQPNGFYTPTPCPLGKDCASLQIPSAPLSTAPAAVALDESPVKPEPVSSGKNAKRYVSGPTIPLPPARPASPSSSINGSLTTAYYVDPSTIKQLQDKWIKKGALNAPFPDPAPETFAVASKYVEQQILSKAWKHSSSSTRGTNTDLMVLTLCEISERLGIPIAQISRTSAEYNKAYKRQWSKRKRSKAAEETEEYMQQHQQEEEEEHQEQQHQENNNAESSSPPRTIEASATGITEEVDTTPESSAVNDASIEGTLQTLGDVAALA